MRAAQSHGRRPGAVRILPGLGFVLAALKRRPQNTPPHPRGERRSGVPSQDLAQNAGIDPDLIDPSQPLSPELAATASDSSFAVGIVGQAMETRRPFGEVAASYTGLPGGLEFTGSPSRWPTSSRSGSATEPATALPLQPAVVLRTWSSRRPRRPDPSGARTVPPRVRGRDLARPPRARAAIARAIRRPRHLFVSVSIPCGGIDAGQLRLSRGILAG